MKRKQAIFWGTLVVSSMMLTACGGGMDHEKMQNMSSGEMQKMDISFQTNPSPLVANQQGTLTALVKMGDKPATDVKVEIETWADGESKHDKEEAVSDKKGGYSIKKTFPKPGTYHAVLHTTSSDLHQMPTVDFEVK